MFPEFILPFLTLTLLETILGIDNVIFISILVDKLPKSDRLLMTHLGLSLALILRIGLLFSITWVMGLTSPLFSLFDHSISGRDIILILGGVFLIGKATFEIHAKVEGDEHHQKLVETQGHGKSLKIKLLIQILLLDIIFSLDSVITAVGMADQISIMIAAMVTSMVIMLASARSIGELVSKHPTLKILSLSFLLLIGVMLTAEGVGHHLPKGFIYFAMFFSLSVEMLNMRYRKNKSRIPS